MSTVDYYVAACGGNNVVAHIVDSSCEDRLSLFYIDIKLIGLFG